MILEIIKPQGPYAFISELVQVYSAIDSGLPKTPDDYRSFFNNYSSFLPFEFTGLNVYQYI
jgi:hypothetical protein